MVDGPLRVDPRPLRLGAVTVGALGEEVDEAPVERPQQVLPVLAVQALRRVPGPSEGEDTIIMMMIMMMREEEEEEEEEDDHDHDHDDHHHDDDDDDDHHTTAKASHAGVDVGRLCEPLVDLLLVAKARGPTVVAQPQELVV
jgi:hypothetical protein